MAREGREGGVLTVRSLLVQTSLQDDNEYICCFLDVLYTFRSTICIHNTPHALPIQFILVYNTYTCSHMLHMTPFPTIRHTI